MQVDWRFMPFLAAGTPAFVDTMVCHLDGGRSRHINHLSQSGQTDPSQTQMTIRATDQPVLHDLGRLRSGSRPIVLAVTLFARLLLLLLRFFLLCFDERWRRRFQLLQFLNACLGYSQLLRDFIEPL